MHLPNHIQVVAVFPVKYPTPRDLPTGSSCGESVVTTSKAMKNKNDSADGMNEDSLKI
jgi:hypothetical protein